MLGGKVDFLSFGASRCLTTTTLQQHHAFVAFHIHCLAHCKCELCRLYRSLLRKTVSTALLSFTELFDNPSNDDIICDRPRYDGLLAGSTISSVWMIFILTYPENGLQVSFGLSHLQWFLANLSKVCLGLSSRTTLDLILVFYFAFSSFSIGGHEREWVGEKRLGDQVVSTSCLVTTIPIVAMIKNNALKIMSLFASVDYLTKITELLSYTKEN